MDPNQTETVEDRINPKYEKLPGEFIYKNSNWGLWSSLDIIKKIENEFLFYPDDILIATYPKSGTTLLQQIVWLIINNVDVEQAKSKSVMKRCPFLDENLEYDFEFYKGFIVNGGSKIPRPRLMKTHLAFQNLENQINKNPEMKILVTIRNPKDNAVSMFHFYKGLVDYGPFEGSWDDFFERWIDGWISGGDWLDVTTEWWNARFRKNIKIVFFEDLIFKKKDVIRDLCEFLNKNLTECQIDKIVEQTEFQAMKANPGVNYNLMPGSQWWFKNNFQFMRKGEVGDWKNYFTEEQSKRLDEKNNRILEECGLEFRYE